MRLLPKDWHAQVISSCNVWGFDVVTKQDQGDEQVVDVGFVHREKDHGHILLQRQDQII